MRPIEFVKNNQWGIAVAIGYVAAAGLGFGLGQMLALEEKSSNESKIRVEQAFAPLNNTPISSDNQTNIPAGQTVGSQAPTPTPAAECAGQIKGNIGSSGKVYHIPGGSSYNRTDPEECFNTEAEAQAAGFRKAAN